MNVLFVYIVKSDERMCVGVRIDAKKIHFMINWTQIHELFVAKLLCKVGAQLCHAFLQQKVEVGSTLVFG